MQRVTKVLDPEIPPCLHLRRRSHPFGRYGGALSSVRADDLGAVPLAALIARHPKLDWQAVVDVIYGCANQAGEDNRTLRACPRCRLDCLSKCGDRR